MAATHFLDFSTPTSYSTPNTLGGLSRIITELPPVAVTITPLLRPLATRKYSVETAMVPTSSAHCSKLSYLIFVKFSASLEGTCGYRTPSKHRKSVDRVPSKSRPKYAKKPKKAKFLTPISPPNGGRFPPNKNRFSQGRQGYKTHGSVWGSGPKTQKCPTPQISTPIARIPRI